MDLNYEYVTDEEGVREALLYIKNRKYVGIDTETTGLDPHKAKIHCIQVGDASKQFIFDYVRTAPYLKGLVDLFEDDSIYWVGQNLKFDFKILKKAFNKAPKNMLDTMIAEQILTNGRNNISAALDAISKKYINVMLDKDVRGSFQDHSYGTMLNEVQQKYAARDILVLIPILSNQLRLIKKSNQIEVFDIECGAISPTAEMEYNGIFLDSEKWRGLYSSAEEKANAAKLKLDSYFLPYCATNLFGEPIVNYNSPAQLLPLLQQITKETIESTDKKTLTKLAETHDVVKALLEYRAATKQTTTYGAAFLENINNVTGRVHSNYAQLRSEQGRYASSGPNMQNIPALPEYRACFRPEDIIKSIMYTADYSGCELRILAELSNDRKFRQIFIEGKDPHKAVAAALSGKRYEDITDKERKPFKAINFGVIYGRGPMNIANDLGVSFEEAKDLVNSYFATFEGVKDFLDSCARDVEINHYAVSTLDGRRRDMSSIDWDDKRMVAHAKNVAKNMPFQGGNASMIKRAMINLNNKRKELKRDDLLLVACVHDEFVVEGDRDKAEAGKNIVSQSMIEAGEYYVKSVPMEVGLDVGDHWIKD